MIDPKPNSTVRRVVVVGDVTMDWNIGRLPGSQETTQSWNTENLIRTSIQRGGAALIAELIGEILKLDSIKQKNYEMTDVTVPAADDDIKLNDPRFHHSYARWSLFEYQKKPADALKDVYAWRVEEFSGLRQSDVEDQLPVWKDALRRIPEADIIVIDDAALGLRYQEDIWKNNPKRVKPDAWTVVKMARPIKTETFASGPLWDYLKDNCADRLIVIVTANDLRQTHVTISRELSWERTAQELDWALKNSSSLSALSRSAYVIVSFDTAGAFLHQRLQPRAEANPDAARQPTSKLFFDPETIERSWSENYSGSMIGYTSCLVASIVHQLMLNPNEPDMPQGIKSGLAAMQKLLQEGFGKHDRKKKEPYPELKLRKRLIVNALSNCIEKDGPFIKSVKESLQEEFNEEHTKINKAAPLLSFSNDFIFRSLRRAAGTKELHVQDIRRQLNGENSTLANDFLTLLQKRHQSGEESEPLPFNEKRVSELLNKAVKQDSTFFEVEVRDTPRPFSDEERDSEPEPEETFWTILGDKGRKNSDEAKASEKSESGLEELGREIILQGAKKALKGVPFGEFGKLLTFDRREIESYRSIRTLIREYTSQARPERPLSIAVFGPPGSGKSFGIGQVAEAVLAGSYHKLTFNLSQFNSPEELLGPLHQVRDAVLKGLTPMVFWDEFDTSLGEPLGWLRYFLAPMQDGEFQQNEITHPIGRSIFVFAGGTCERMKDFVAQRDPKRFKAVKGPDFVSRLKGYVDIRGPNPKDEDASSDPSYIIRRAVLLRSVLERNAPALFTLRDVKGKLNIDDGVLRAFLKIPKYKHGARSMESIIAMSGLAGNPKFERSALPAKEQLDLHVDGYLFLALIEHVFDDKIVVEQLAKLTHEVYSRRLRARGEQEKYENAQKTYEQLDEEEKNQNRKAVKAIPKKLESLGYIMVPTHSGVPQFEITSMIEQLAKVEHERWAKSKIEDGFSYAPVRNNEKHPALLPWDMPAQEYALKRYSRKEQEALGMHRLPEDEREKDRDQVAAILLVLREKGYSILKLQQEEIKEPPRAQKSLEKLRIGVLVLDSQVDKDQLGGALDNVLRRIEDTFPHQSLIAVSNLSDQTERFVAGYLLTRPAAELLAVLPLPKSTYLNSFTLEEEKFEVLRFLKKAKQVITATLAETPAASCKEAYNKLLTNSDLLIVIGDKKEQAKKHPRKSNQKQNCADEVLPRARERGWPIAWINSTKPEVSFDYFF